MADTVEITQAYTFDGTTYRHEMPKEVAEKYSIAGTVDATASAKELAAQEGVDLASVDGTGKDGRITKGDVEDAVEE